MSNMSHTDFALAGGIHELSFDEIDAISGASELGENVLVFGGAGGAIGGLIGGPKGAAVGVLVGAAVGVIVTVADDE